MEFKKCPRCGKVFNDYPALSRRDNKTEICPDCGTAEAFEDFLGRKYEGEPYWGKVDEQLTEAANSNGIYSLKSGWLKTPVKDDIPDDVDLEPELSDWLERASHCKTIEDVDNFIDDVYKLRQSSLLQDGEYGKGNLIFKEIRNKGILQGLKDKKVELENDEMSIDEDAALQEKLKKRRNECVEYYHHLMEARSLPGEYSREHPTIDNSVLERVNAKYGYGKSDIVKFIKESKYENQKV